MSHSPDSGWVIQDLDMMYPPQDRARGFPIKTEVTPESCDYGVAPTPASGQIARSQACAVSTSYSMASNNASSFNSPYNETITNVPQANDWPSDLENIFNMDTPLPTDCDSPLKLEDYNMEFVYVNPSTLDQNPASQQSSTYISSPCTQMQYSNSPCGATPSSKPIQAPQYFEAPLPPYNTEPSVLPDMGQGACIPGPGRIMGSRGRPRNEWRITGKLKEKKGCVGRPRSKPARVGRPLGLKKEPVDMFDDADSFSDPCEEKKERRREQNRRAARKLREKKKVHVENMKKDYEGIIQDNRRLTKEVDTLRNVVQQLRLARDNHVCSCRDGFAPTPPSATSRAASNYGNSARAHSEHTDITSFSHAD